MANIIGNDISFFGPSDALRELKETMANEVCDFDLNKIIPISDNPDDYQAVAAEHNKVRELLRKDNKALEAAHTVFFVRETPTGQAEFPNEDIEPLLDSLREALKQDVAALPEPAEEDRFREYEIRDSIQALVNCGFLEPDSPRAAAELLWGARPSYDSSEPGQYLFTERLDEEDGYLQYQISTAWESPEAIFDEIARRFPEVKMVVISDFEGNALIRIVTRQGEEKSIDFEDFYDKKKVKQACKQVGVEPVSDFAFYEDEEGW